MELELKHIAPYFPYSLKMAYLDRAFDKSGKVSKLGTLEGISHNEHETHPTRLRLEYMEYEHIWMFKPILRPLSELNENYHSDFDDFFNESNYVVIENGVYGLSLHEGDGVSDGIDFEQTLKLTILLFKHHFDIFALIKEGLAIDINSIEANPSVKTKI
jgi:hypothetical protein